MDKNKIGQFIARLRKEQGLNQKELAEKLCVTDTAFFDIEISNADINDRSLIDLISRL